MSRVETPLDKLSNRAVDAIEAGRFKQAEQLCKKLLRVYRKAPDGHERMAMLREAQEQFEEAARHYDRLLEMMQKKPREFDPESVQYFTERRDQARAKAKS
jgi:tetratricopeptide (TPR) repeat protein|tara:strand:- start:99 stop:401 length:303 start_codon:yes stop_codon:yes gene_type:complete